MENHLELPQRTQLLRAGLDTGRAYTYLDTFVSATFVGNHDVTRLATKLIAIATSPTPSSSYSPPASKRPVLRRVFDLDSKDGDARRGPGPPSLETYDSKSSAIRHSAAKREVGHIGIDRRPTMSQCQDFFEILRDQLPDEIETGYGDSGIMDQCHDTYNDPAPTEETAR